MESENFRFAIPVHGTTLVRAAVPAERSICLGETMVWEVATYEDSQSMDSREDSHRCNRKTYNWAKNVVYCIWMQSYLTKEISG